MSPPPVWPRRAHDLPDDDGQQSSAPGKRVQASKDSVAAGRDVGAVITGDNNTITVLPPTQGASAANQNALVTRLIRECHPLDLEVHHAIHVAAEESELPAYVQREHDIHLQQIVRAAQGGKSQLCVLVGESSTGKTRAAWEAVQILSADEWELWHPFDPTRADAALAGLAAVGPKTVVWLNEAQHYLAHPMVGEKIAAALRTLLGDTHRAPILVLGTVWPVHWDHLTSLPIQPGKDPQEQSRQLLTGRQIHVPDTFTERDLVAVRNVAQVDERLAQALAGAADRRITQFLAGVPALLDRYKLSRAGARALLHVAMDARRLGCGMDLPAAFLEEAAMGYLSETELSSLDDDWFEQALAYTGRTAHGNTALLRRTRRRPGSEREDSFRLADYMEQHGRRERNRICPPASFWDAALRHLPRRADVSVLAAAASARWRLRYGRLLAESARQLPWLQPSLGPDAHPPVYGGPDDSVSWPVNHLTCRALADLAFTAAQAADYEQAAALAMDAAECCQPDALADIALQHEEAGLTVEASDLAHHAAALGAPACLSHLAMMREGAALFEQAEHYARAAAEYGLTNTLADLAAHRETAGDKERAEELWEAAAAYGHPEALANIARFRYESGDIEEAARIAREAVDQGDAAHPYLNSDPIWGKLWPHGIEPDGTPTPHYDDTWLHSW